MRILLISGLTHLIACNGSQEEEKVDFAPVITGISIAPSGAVFTTSEVQCIATATDDNNDALTMSYQWQDEQGSSLGEGTSIALNYEMVRPGDSLYCFVTVSDGETEVRDQTSVVIENTPPEVTAVQITPDEVTTNSLLECSFGVYEADGEQVTASYSWTHNGSEVASSSSLQLSADDFATGDTLTCTVTLEDESGGTGSGSADVLIGNTPPVIGSTTITPEEPYSFDTLTCTANDIMDADFNDVTLSYEWLINSEVQEETSNVLSGPFSVGDSIVCRVTPNDGYTNGVKSQDVVRIINSAPTIDSIEITPAAGVEADTMLTCSAVGSDADNEELTTSYSWTDAAGNVLASSDMLQLDTSMVSPDDVLTCTATVTDPNGESVTQTAMVSVENTDPVVDSDAMITGDATTTSTVLCSASFSDANDGALTTSYAWTNAQGMTVGSSSSYTILASDTDVGEALTCTASATDSNGAAVSSSTSIIIENTAPVLSGVSLSPDPAGTEDTLTCSVASTSDLDEDAVDVVYQWTVDGMASSETSNMLSGPFVIDAVIVCSATANDGTEDGNTETASVTISNSVPVVDSVELNSGPVYTDDTLMATASISDADSGQTVSATYAWFVTDVSNGGTLSEVQTGSMDSLDGSFFDKGDEVYVVVTPSDGIADGTAFTSDSIIITNSEPTLSSVVITPSSATIEDDLTCMAIGTDADGDALTYTYVWTSPSGVETTVPSTSSTSDMLVAANELGEWACTVTPNDGTDGASDSAMVTVEAVEGEVVTGSIKPFGEDHWLLEITDTSVSHTVTMQKDSLSGLGERMMDIYDPTGTLITDSFGEYMGGSSTLFPYSFTPSMTGTYRVVTYGYRNDQGAYTLEVSDDSQLLVLTQEEQIPTPSQTPMTLFVPTQPTNEWTETVTGDFNLSKRTETWEFSGLEGQHLRIDMAMVAPYPNDNANNVDAYLYLFDSSGNLLASDDDAGVGNNARIFHTLDADDTYHVVATTYGKYREAYWDNIDETNWTLGTDGIGHYEMTVKASETLDYEVEPVAMTNLNAVPINVVFLYQDEDLLNIPRPKSEVEDLIADLNEDFDSLYSSGIWQGFEIASYTHYYEADYSFTSNPHGALADVGASPVAITEHVNVIITEIDNTATGIVGTTNLKGDMLSKHGVSLVLDNEAGSSVLIHEMGHVLGVQHTAGTWPPKQHFIDLADGTEMGYNTFDHPCPEMTHMSQWDNYGFEGDWKDSWYLTATESTLNTPTHGRLFAEALRTWLIDSAHISPSAPSTGYQGFDEGDGNADAYWTWEPTEDVDEATTHSVLPLSASASDPTNNAAVLMWEKTSSNEAMIRYRDSAGVWQDAESMPLSTGGIIRGKRVAIGSQGHAAALIEGDPEQLELRFHDGQSSTWGATEIVSEGSLVGTIVYQASVAVNASGDTAVIWVYRAQFGDDYEVRLRTRSSQGVWSAPEELYSGADEVAYPELAMNDSGDIYAVWQRMDSGVFVTEGQWYDGDSGMWGAASTLSSGIYHAGLAQVAMNANGDAVIVWREADTAATSDLALSGHLLSRSFTAPNTLGAEVEVSSIGADAFHTSTVARRNNVVISDTGDAAVTWSGFDGEDYRIYVAERDASLTWGAPLALSEAGQHAKLPNLVQDDEGTLALIWQRTDGLHSRIQASVLDTSAGMWSVPVTLSEEGGPAFWSTINADGGGDFSVYWARKDDSTYQIQSRTGSLVP